MATKTQKAVAVKKVKAEPKAPKRDEGKLVFGSESHAVRTIEWAMNLGLVPKSVYEDSVRASKKSELLDGLKRVKVACEIKDYLQQAKLIEQVIQKLEKSPD